MSAATAIGVDPECTYDPPLAATCEREAVYELTILKQGDLTGDRVEFSCDEHVDALVGDDTLFKKHRLDNTSTVVIFDGTSTEVLGLNPISPVGPVRAFTGEDDPEIIAAHADRVPAGWECTRDPDHSGPCALEPVVTAESITVGGKRLTAGEPVTTSPYRIATVPTPYRPTKWSSPWILLLPLLGWELWTVATGKAGGPLSHLVWWAYGDRYSLRWFLMSMGMNGLGVWAAAHFMFEKWEVRELGFCVGIGLILGLIGWLLTAVKW